MGSEEIAQPYDFGTLSAPQVAMPVREDYRFWIALACATALHIALIAGAIRSVPAPNRIMGEKDGAKDGISVEIVDASALKPNSALPQPQQQQPAQQQTAPQQPVQEKTPPETKTETAAIERSAPPEERAEEKATQTPERKKAPPESKAGDLRELLAIPEFSGKAGGSTPPPKPAPKAQQQPAKQEQQAAKQANLQLPQSFSAPQTIMNPQGRTAGVSRPAGITRSGENDDFGRGVIRALRQTMPSPYGATGRVTVRLILSETGNLVEVRLVRSGGNSSLDQSVVFAVKQSSFPIPPSRSTLDDRTFLVTYVYL